MSDQNVTRVLWADADGEFITEFGFARIRCASCDRQAVVRVDGVHRCDVHVPAHLQEPALRG